MMKESMKKFFYDYLIAGVVGFLVGIVVASITNSNVLGFVMAVATTVSTKRVFYRL